MTADPALHDEEAVAAWLSELAPAEREGALESAALGHGLQRRADEQLPGSRSQGTWYTPRTLVACVLDAALTPELLRSGTVCDTACGSGNFLVQAAERMLGNGRSPEDVARSVHGCDIDPKAVALARVRLQRLVGGSRVQWQRSVWCGDALGAGAWAGRGLFDAVIGNPPFLGQLKSGSAATREQSAVLKQRFGGVVKGYADTACAFLMLACECAAGAGRIALVLPMSLLASADAEPVRAFVNERFSVVECLVPPVRVFGGGVPTVVLVLRKRKSPLHAEPARIGAPELVRVRRVRGQGEHRALTVGAEPGELRWSAMPAALQGVPHVEWGGQGGGTLADVATASADFRQQYYGLRGHLKEWADASSMPDPNATGHAAVVTVGSIDAAECRWGRRDVRLLGQSFVAPVVDVQAMRADSATSRWLDDRMVPKIVVPTQTRVLEAWVDERGHALPSTPLISVMPRRANDLWLVAAAILAPAASAVAWWRHAGAALSPTAIKLSARQLLELPIPRSAEEWRRGARVLAAWQAAGDPSERTAHAAEFAEVMDGACGVSGGRAHAGRELREWWLHQVEARKPGRVFC
ncbi:MAG: N-6 DNA methylase [Phycisphaerae bacterium]|nr:N-6 DNA methylase [Phycisphaerae bacterium]